MSNYKKPQPHHTRVHGGWPTEEDFRVAAKDYRKVANAVILTDERYGRALLWEAGKYDYQPDSIDVELEWQ